MHCSIARFVFSRFFLWNLCIVWQLCGHIVARHLVVTCNLHTTCHLQEVLAVQRQRRSLPLKKSSNPTKSRGEKQTFNIIQYVRSLFTLTRPAKFSKVGLKWCIWMYLIRNAACEGKSPPMSNAVMSLPIVSKQLQIVPTCANQSSQYHVAWRLKIPPPTKTSWKAMVCFVCHCYITSIVMPLIWYKTLINYRSHEPLAAHLHYISKTCITFHHVATSFHWVEGSRGSCKIHSCSAMFNSELPATPTWWQRHDECSSIASTW